MVASVCQPLKSDNRVNFVANEKRNEFRVLIVLFYTSCKSHVSGELQLEFDPKMRNIWVPLVLLLGCHIVSSRNIVKRSCCYSDCTQQCNQNCQTTCSNCQSNCNTCQATCANNCRYSCANNCGSTNCNTNDCTSNNCVNNNCNSNNCNKKICNSNNCSNDCSSGTCKTIETNCGNCQPVVPVEDKVPVLVPFPPNTQGQSSVGVSPSISSNNTNNYTAEININNVINTINNVSVPINVNSSNINHITLHPSSSRAVEIETTKKEQIASNCCVVIHPRQCDRSGYCYSRSSYECSEICSGKVIKIERGE